MYRGLQIRKGKRGSKAAWLSSSSTLVEEAEDEKEAGLGKEAVAMDGVQASSCFLACDCDGYGSEEVTRRLIP